MLEWYDMRRISPDVADIENVFCQPRNTGNLQKWGMAIK